MKHQGITYSDGIYYSAESCSDVALRSHKNYSITLNDDFKGHDVRLEHPRDGISLSINNVCFETDTTMPYQVGEGAVTITTVLSGRIENNMLLQKPCTVEGVGKPCDMVLLSDNFEGRICIKGGESLRAVAAYVAKDLILEMTEGEERFAGLAKALRKNNGFYQIGAFTASPKTQLIATQILNCRLHGSCRRLYMESKALELICATLERVGADARPGHPPLSRSDVERIREAKRLLVEDIIDPPGIKELSKLTGINEFKLKHGFREIFGCPIYQYLRTHRMESARNMLGDTDTTVGTVAAMVGYTNMSHFIAAFRNQFGVTPGALLSHYRCHKQR